VKGIHDVITRAKFGDDRLRGSGVIAGQISAFPVDFAGRPYNTVTLLCERVMFLAVGCRWAEMGMIGCQMAMSSRGCMQRLEMCVDQRMIEQALDAMMTMMFVYIV